MLIKGTTSLVSTTLGGNVTIDQINSEGDVHLIKLTNIVYIPTLPVNLVLSTTLFYLVYQIENPENPLNQLILKVIQLKIEKVIYVTRDTVNSIT